VRVDRHPIPTEFSSGNFMADSKLRKRVQAWLHDLWQRKDRRIEEILAGEAQAAGRADATR
jgi:hypothetical protein